MLNPEGETQFSERKENFSCRRVDMWFCVRSLKVREIEDVVDKEKMLWNGPNHGSQS